jgi:hypothetical protein
MQDSQFDGFIEFGREVMRGLARDEQDATRYRWLLGVITELLTVTHGMIVDDLDDVIEAETIDDARTAVDRLRGEPLSRSFHAEGLCDSFVGLGHALRDVNERTRGHLAESGARPRFGERLDTADDFAMILMDREEEVAGRYGSEIIELRDLLFGARQTDDLEVVREQAVKAKRVLTDQIADFTSLAGRFKGSMSSA